MKVLQVNTVFINGGSTGRIVYDLMQYQQLMGVDAYVAYGYNTHNRKVDNTMCLQGFLQRKVNILRTRLYDRHGFYNELETIKLISWISSFKPDIIHLHNIHNHYVHVGKLFDYIKKHHIPVVWTLHDCWPFTGHCAYFDFSGCEKWKSECHNCPSLKDYPPTWFFDRSTDNYNRKRRSFCGVENLTLVTPSKWLADLTRHSFIKEYPVIVINNGVDINTFKCDAKNNLKDKIGITGKKVLLAMASDFGERKGGRFLKILPELLKVDEILILVGSGASKQAKRYPNNCIGIEYTNNVDELVDYYSMADVFINPTMEDNFPTTNIEAMACGTPVVTFNTGGSIESVLDGESLVEKDEIKYTSVGAVVPKGNLELMLKASRKIIDDGKNGYSIACRKKALDKYNKEKQYVKYIDLYKEMLR